MSHIELKQIGQLLLKIFAILKEKIDIFGDYLRHIITVYRLPKKIYYFNTDYWRKSGATNKICKEFNVKEVPSLIKIKSGKTVEKRDLSKFIEK